MTEYVTCLSVAEPSARVETSYQVRLCLIDNLPSLNGLGAQAVKL